MVDGNIVIKDARIMFRNFSGKEGKFNPAGKRNFCVAINNDIADNLISDGWNIRFLKARDEDEDDQAYLSVSVSYGNIPPHIYMVTSKNKVELFEDTVGQLDWAEIKKVDLEIRPYNWDVNGKSGVKAYVKTMYVTIDEDVFAKDYEHISMDDEDLPF